MSTWFWCIIYANKSITQVEITSNHTITSVNYANFKAHFYKIFWPYIFLTSVEIWSFNANSGVNFAFKNAPGSTYKIFDVICTNASVT